MSDTLDLTTLERWKASPIEFIEHVLYDPETGKPFQLLDAEKRFLQHAFKVGADGRLLYPEQLYGEPKKSGKTGFAALHMLTTVLLSGGAFAEGYALANDEEQAASRVFAAMVRIIEASPLLRREAKITADKIAFSASRATINTVASNYGTAAGANPTISCFDEAWAYVSERSHRLWDEMMPPPTRKIACRLTVTYAGFEGESTMLQALYQRGLQQQLIGTDLHAGDGILMFWSHDPIAPWQTESWLAEMRRSLRPNQYLRMIENRFVTSESSFIDMPHWDRIVQPNIGAVPHNLLLPVWIGVDASVKHDSSAIVAVTYDSKAKVVRLVFHRIFQPTPETPINFEQTIEATLIDLHKRFQVRKILADPYQMVATMQRLARMGLPIEEFAQSSPNITAASQQLYELIHGQALVCYPDAAMRLAMSRTIAKETSRGWHISKQQQSHKIDVIVALAMACHAAVQGQAEPFFDRSWNWVDTDRDAPLPSEEDPKQREARQNADWRRTQYFRHLINGGGDGSLYGARTFRWS